MEHQSSMETLALNGSSGLTPQEREAILTTLEGCTNILTIYQHTLRKPQKHLSDISLDYIFSDIDDFDSSNVELSPEVLAGIQEIKEGMADAKLYDDSVYLMNIIEELKREILEHGTFKVLTKEMEKIVRRQKEEKALEEEAEKLRKVVADLRKTIAEEKIVHDEERNRLVKEFADEQRQKQRAKLIADVESRYVAAWERAKCEQHFLRSDMEIQELEKILEEYRVREENEKRAHAELTSFLKYHIASIEKKIEEWEERYNREKTIYEKDIGALRLEIEEQQKMLDELKEEYRTNQEFIDAYQAEKEAIKKEKELEEHMRKSAIRVQAWWRGIMVRRKLGPYRPEEKKKKRTTKKK